MRIRSWRKNDGLGCEANQVPINCGGGYCSGRNSQFGAAVEFKEGKKARSIVLPWPSPYREMHRCKWAPLAPRSVRLPLHVMASHGRVRARDDIARSVTFGLTRDA